MSDFIGAVKIWDPRQKEEPVATMEPGEGEDRRDCWAVAFGVALLITPIWHIVFLGHAYNKHDRTICSGYDNGDIKLFDLRAMALRWETNVKNGVRLGIHTGSRVTDVLYKFRSAA